MTFPRAIGARRPADTQKGPIMTTARRETAILIIGALMLFGAAATVAEAQERAHERAAVSVGEPAPVLGAAHPGL